MWSAMVVARRSTHSWFRLIVLVFAATVSFTVAAEDAWGQWSDFAECSRTCGGGIQQRTRICLRGRSEGCHGDNVEYQSCNSQECPLGSVDFRTHQCISHVSLPDGTNSTWLPFVDGDAPCTLYCRNQQGAVKKFLDTVEDGTHCDRGDQFGVCISGICQPVGCDHLLGSLKAEDKCLVCGGDGGTCNTESGSTLGQTLEFNKRIQITTFPSGASKIVIKQHSLSASSGKVELTTKDGKVLKLSEVFTNHRKRHAVDFAGTQFHYNLIANGVKFSARGPLNDTLHLMFTNMMRSASHNPYVEFEFSVPKSGLSTKSLRHRYEWVFGSWTSCSEKCGTGYQLRAVSCIDQDTGRAASPQLCSQQEPPVRNQTCTGKVCDKLISHEYKWIEGNWGKCSVDCGLGEQSQTMLCIKTDTYGNSDYVLDDVCLQHVGAPPAPKRVCYGEGDNCPYWAAGSWSECSASCGLGSQTRNIYCQQDPPDATQDPVIVNESDCLHEDRPQQVQNCSQHLCAGETDSTVQLSEVLEEDSGSVENCRTSVYGCCPDNVTPAMGPGHFGCKHKVTTESICGQPKDAGTCVDYTVRWYFDVSSGTCHQFWYGSCGGNSNRFSTKDECEDNCIKGRQSGPGTKSAVTSVRCEDSKYGCCLDQQSAAEGPNYAGCKDTCEDSEYGCCTDGITPAEGPDQEGCDVSSGTLPCEKTTYGCCADGITVASGASFAGCGDTPDAEKEKASPTATHSRHATEKRCTAPGSRDVCTEYTVKWRFDTERQECVRHWWGGCADNGNVFESQEECNAECKKKEVVTTTASPIQEKCTAEATRTLCTEYTVKWRFDKDKQECIRLWWGGCADNGNIFESQADCEDVCMNTMVITNPDSVDRDFVNICDMPADTGPCRGSILRYYYDSRDRTCHKFYYGGCQGNENNFVEIEDCQQECMPGVETSHSSATAAQNKPETSHSSATRAELKPETSTFPTVTAENKELNYPKAVCLMPAAPGPCSAGVKRWFYDHQSGTCSQFQYGGCEGNRNNFETLEECNDFCNDKEVCLQPKETGPCRAAFPRFFFDSQTRSCQSFTYGGCQGNLNNFATKEACDNKCPGSQVDVLITGTDNEVNVCQLKPEKGNCRGYNIMWYYSAERNLCSRFVYTGCGGNGNQFNSEEECNDECLTAEDTNDSDNLKQTSTTLVETTASTSLYPSSHSLSTASSHRGAGRDHQLVLVKLGASAELTCTLRHYGVLWDHNGFRLASNSHLEVYNNGTLVLLGVTEDMSGTYSCRIYDGHSTPHSEKFRVEVYVPPKILHGPVLISVKPGHTAVVHCQVEGSPKPVVSWSRQGHVLQTDSHYSVFANGTLVIHDVLTHDAGDYECSADNGITTVQKHIHVNIKETIGADIQRHQGIFTEGETIQLHCKGTGYPVPQIEWVKEGNVLESDGKVLVSGGDLTITSVTIEDAGMYKCVASNDKGKAEDVTTVQINFHNHLTKCEDTMGKVKCHLIVTGRLCGFRMFVNKCCHSCRKAGLI